jgi:hypothetical protein
LMLRRKAEEPVTLNPGKRRVASGRPTITMLSSILPTALDSADAMRGGGVPPSRLEGKLFPVGAGHISVASIRGSGSPCGPRGSWPAPRR